VLATVTVLLVTTSWVSYLAPKAIRNHSETFLALGANLPRPTRFLLATPQVWLVFLVAAVALFVWVIARSRVTSRELGRMKLALSALIVATLVAYGLAAWTIYTPMLELATVA